MVWGLRKFCFDLSRYYHSAVTAQKNSKTFWTFFLLLGLSVDHINHMIGQKCLEFMKDLFRVFLLMFLGLIFNALCSRINYKTLQDYVIMHIIRKLL